MSRRHRHVPGRDQIVRFVCIDRYHEGASHLVAVMRLTESGLEQRGRRVAEYARPDGDIKYTFTCKCGRNQQYRRSELGRVAADLFAVKPGATRVDLEIATLRGVASGYGDTASGGALPARSDSPGSVTASPSARSRHARD